MNLGYNKYCRQLDILSEDIVEEPDEWKRWILCYCMSLENSFRTTDVLM